MPMQRAFGLVVLVTGIALYAVRLQVEKIKRFRPETDWIDQSGNPDVHPNRLLAKRGFDVDDRGLPVRTVEEIIPAGCSIAGGYKNYTCGPPIHIHRFQDERFTVLQGELGFVINGKERTLKAGKGPNVVPMGIPHTFFNPDKSRDVHFKVELISRVGNETDFAQFLETIWGLSRDYGDINKIPLLQLILTFTDPEVGGMAFDAPWPINWLVRNVANPIAKIVGYKAVYREYLRNSV